VRSVLAIGGAALGAFVVVFSSILLVWLTSLDEVDCRGDSCALEWAAVVSFGLLVSVLAAAVAGFVVFVGLKARSGRTDERSGGGARP
jgi:hypothetical protein